MAPMTMLWATIATTRRPKKITGNERRVTH